MGRASSSDRFLDRVAAIGARAPSHGGKMTDKELADLIGKIEEATKNIRRRGRYSFGQYREATIEELARWAEVLAGLEAQAVAELALRGGRFRWDRLDYFARDGRVFSSLPL